MRHFLFALILFLSCSTRPEDIPGCTDSTACNYNSEANEDDGSCAFKPDNCGICDNDPSNDCVQDCAGVWGGDTPESECAECTSNNFDCAGNCCVDGFIFDMGSISQTENSCWEKDNCEICDDDSDNDCVQDCAGIWGGGHESDENGFTTVKYVYQELEFYCADLFALQQIINANDFSVEETVQNTNTFHPWDFDGNGKVDPWEFGGSEQLYWWEEGRLTFLKVDIPITLTEDLGSLTELKQLNFETNRLEEIHESVGLLVNLKILIITSNPLSVIPESISNLINLEELVISNNELSILPENIGNLVNLKKLDAANNQVISIPESIGSLINLTHLYLENNQLNSLSAALGALSNLSELRLQNNDLVDLPDNFGEFDSLIFLYLNNNLFESLPENFGKMNSLKKLRLNDNKLQSLPESISYMQSLEELWLQRNQINFLPDEIGELGLLRKLYLDHNQLVWLPDALCNIYSELDAFSVSNNSLCALTVPACVSYFSDVGNQSCMTNECPPHHFKKEGYCVFEQDYNILQEFLDLNPESQSLPNNVGIPESANECVNTDWWEEGRLVEITFHHKQLKSIIPENIGDLTMLEILRLTGNELTGEIPDNISNLNNLNILKLNSNKLSGGIPENIGTLSNIDTLWLNNNNLGCYEYNYECDPFGKKSYCCATHCDNINQCSGEIPQSITNLNGLQHLQLQENNLSGFIPEEIGSMDSLKYLYLDNNQLSGEIPQSIGDLPILRRLYIYNNNLSGQIPESICNIYTANGNFQSYFHNNKLCPPYPDCVPLNHLGITVDNVIQQDITNCNE